MEEMFLRVFVVLASLVCLKDHTFFEEQDDIMDMQEREHFLQKEGPKPEQEVNPVAMVPTLVSQSHHRLTKGEGEEGDVQQILPNGKVEDPREHQTLPTEDQNILHHKLLTEDDPDELQTDKKVLQQVPNRDLPAKNLSPKEGMQPEILHSNQNATEQVPPKGNETVIQKDPHAVNDTEATSETQTSTAVHDQGQEASHVDQAKEISQEKPKSFFQQTVFGFIRTWFQASQGVQPSLEKEFLEGSKTKTEEIDESTSKADKGDPQTTNRISHADQKPSTPRQVQTKALEGEQNTYTWYFWKVLSLISVIRLFRKFILRTSGKRSPVIEGNKVSGTVNLSAKLSLLDHQVLSCFYEKCIQIPPSTRERVCDFVEVFVDELLEAVRSNKGNYMQIGDFARVGSLYELWATGRTMVCDLYIPITAPRPYSFDVELDLPSCGRIKLVKAQNTSYGCSCSNGMMDDEDMLCLIHPHKETNNVIMDAVDGPLCQENTPYLAKTQVVKWFRQTFSKAWGENSHRYEFELSFRNQTVPAALKVRLRSGQTILFNLTPVVQVKSSDMYLVSYLHSDQRNFSDTHWPVSLASYENALLQHFTKSLPCDSCHIHCLQIFSFLLKQQNRLTGKCWLTSYHLKITLLHLLLVTKPLEWKSELLANRLTDMLIFLDQSVKARRLHHSLVGNPLVPSSIGLPKELYLAKPTNIFLPLVSDQELYLKTVQHLQELAKNAPVLINEYVLMK